MNGSEYHKEDHKYQVVVVGLGHQGSGIARLVVELCHELLGAVDVGSKVGQPISEILGGFGPDKPVVGSIDELLSAGAKPDSAVLAAAIDPNDLLTQARQFFSQGVDVVTLHQDLFSPGPSWTQELKKIAVAGGASFFLLVFRTLGGSISPRSSRHRRPLLPRSDSSVHPPLRPFQRTWEGWSGLGNRWKTLHVRRISCGCTGRAGRMSPRSGRRMACSPGQLTKSYESITLDTTYEWEAAGETIPAGFAAGIREVVSFDTDLAIRFEGEFKVLPVPVEKASEELTILGSPDITIRVDSHPGNQIKNVALLARIPDVVAAKPGVLFAADLGPPGPLLHTAVTEHCRQRKVSYTV